jgi:hypothetical protein
MQKENLVLCNYPPILIIAFNRPGKIKRLLDLLHSYQDTINFSSFYFAIDGPRASKTGEALQVNKVIALCREFAEHRQASFLIRDSNLGCGKAVQSALDWFFQKEEMGIILEDDILPSRFFFTFMQENLEKYRHDPNIFSINGHALGFTDHPYTGYGITPYFNMWGWATWRRSNELVHKLWYDHVSMDITALSEHLSAFDLPLPWRRKRWRQHWKHTLERTAAGMVDTWDYQWVYASVISGSVCIRPNYNLTENTGYDGSGTHTFSVLQGMYLNHAVIPDRQDQTVQHPKKASTHWKYEVYHVAELWNGMTLNPVKIGYSFLRKLVSRMR